MNGVLSPETVRAAIRPRQEHYARTRLVSLENTHNRAGGTIWPLEAMEAVIAVAREHDLLVHLDGARLWNASAATGVSPARYCSGVDTVSVCFSKGLGAPVGSALAGPREVVEKARFNRKKYGGAMRQVGILGAAALYALDNHRERLTEDHANATLLGDALRGLAGVTLSHPVQTNIVIVEVSGLGRGAGEVVDELRAEGVLASPATATAVRFVTHLDVSTEQVKRAARIVERVFGRLAQSGYVA